jgi:8-amino-7-oxononanoate synthase
MDILDKVSLYRRAQEARDSGNYPYFLPLENSEGAIAHMAGRPVIMLGSNNYLGLTMNERVQQAAIEAIAKYGTSCTGSRFLNGTLELHLKLERRLAEFHDAEDAQTFTTGYQVNVGVISALAGQNDHIIVDQEAHASIIDGCLHALARGARLQRFRHNDLESLESNLQEIPSNAAKLVIVDGVYSMSGDIAPLPQITEICKRYGARIMVDDAHGIGVMGESGRGTVASFGLENEIDIITGTFSKSFASVGGYVVGRSDTIDYIRHSARSLLFSASIPAANVATVLAVMDELATFPEILTRLWENVAYMRKQLGALGLDIGNSKSPIIPIKTGDEETTGACWRILLDHGVYTNPIVPPAAPANGGLLRTSYMATHTKQQLDTALQGFRLIKERLDCKQNSNFWDRVAQLAR